MSKKKLYRSTQNKVICGLLGGIGEYLDIDPAILRVGFIIVAFLTALMPWHNCLFYFLSCGAESSTEQGQIEEKIKALYCPRTG